MTVPFGKDHIASIDGLRAVAVLAVIAFHLDTRWLPGGFAGVDVFYVISGFVVAASVASSAAQSFPSYLVLFYRRRLVRIMPALMLFVLVLCLCSALFIPTAPFTKFIEPTGISALFGLSNFILLYRAGDYFSPSTALNPFTHTWSLAVEEQYYLVFPVFSYFLVVVGARFYRAKVLSILFVIGASLASLIACIALAGRHDEFAFYMLFTRFWELGLGFLLYQLVGAKHAFTEKASLAESRRTWTLVSIASAILLVLSLWFADESAFPFPWALPVCTATAGLIGGTVLSPRTGLTRLLASPVATLIGRASYSLYLWHWGVIVLMRWTVGVDTIATKAVAALTMVLLTGASYALVERPARYSARLAAMRPTRYFATFALALVGTAATCTALYVAKPAIGLFTSKNAQVWSPDSIPPVSATACAVERKTVKRFGGTVVEFRPTRCERPVRHTLYVIGDSHAEAYIRMLHSTAATGHYAVQLYTRGGCKVIPYFDPRPINGCDEFRTASMMDVARSAHAGDVLFAVGLYTRRYRDVWDGPMLESRELDLLPAPSDATLLPAAASMFAPVASKGVKIVLEAPKPLVRRAQFRCADWFNQHNSYCLGGADAQRDDLQLRGARARHFLLELAASTPGTTVWDAYPILCPEAICRGYRDGKPLYYDTDHLSGFGNDLLFPEFMRMLAELR